MSKQLIVEGPLQASNQIFPLKKVPIYPIAIEKDYSALPALLKDCKLTGGKVMLVTDTNIGKHYIPQIRRLIENDFISVEEIILEAGEEYKNLDSVKRIFEKLIQCHFDRNDVLFALGGGVIGDMTGFTAATYLRGIRFVQLPTSLLSMVDSSIGGKTGVDFQAYKNMVGAFYQPQAVYINLSVLSTLPDREFYSGFGEIIKHGLIKDFPYYSFLKENVDSILNRDYDALERVIYESCKIKKAVVENDPTEKGERALLNFGHTIGHAIEKFMDFTLLHGECVAVGMVAASYLSYLRGNLSKEELKDIIVLLEHYHLPVVVHLDDRAFNQTEVLSIIKHDKKVVSGLLRFILLKMQGYAYIDEKVSEDELIKAISFIMGVKYE